MVVAAEPPCDATRVAELFLGCPTRVRGRHPANLEVARAHLEMERELLVDIPGDVGSQEAAVPPPRRLTSLAVHASNPLMFRQARLGAARSTCVTAPAYVSQRAASLSRCRRPVGVSS